MQITTQAQWDIFCRVIDNYGDVGVCWRLSTELASLGCSIRLFIDDASALDWMSPQTQRTPCIQILDWNDAQYVSVPAPYVIESFGCDLPEPYIAKMVMQKTLGQITRWLNLEYLTAESHSERNHLLPSPILHGCGQGLTKTFFYPGFTAQTGGLMRESNLNQRQATFNKAQWLVQQGISWQGECIISLFCYEPTALAQLLDALENLRFPILLLVTAGRAQNAVHQCRRKTQQTNPRTPLSSKVLKQLTIIDLPYLTQIDFDHLLWASDLNFVRGEDSLVRAIWAGKPFIWQIYPQHDQAHYAKLTAFLKLYLKEIESDLAEKIEHIFYIWNDISSAKYGAFAHLLEQLPAWETISFQRKTTWEKLPNLLHSISNHLNLPYFQTA